MKILNKITIASISFLALLATVTALPAQPRTKTFEMADGHTITFKMTEKEIVEYEKIQSAIRAIIANNKKIAPQVTRFELAESGITIDFRMSDKEVLRQKQLNKLFFDIDLRNKRNVEAPERRETIEMADGQLITF